jgi:hypothetical protein
MKVSILLLMMAHYNSISNVGINSNRKFIK